MLKPVKTQARGSAGGSFAIVASRYNARYVQAMVRAARTELTRAKAAKVRLVQVPGAYEIPIVAANLARPGPARPDAIICLGVILRGETVHAAHIGEAVSRALMDLQLQSGVPVIHEVLLLENEQQARARCLSKTHNRGAEAAHTAVAMVEVMRRVAARPD